MLENNLNIEIFWSLICVILSIGAHFFRKKLLKIYIKEKNRIKQKEQEGSNENFRKNVNEHILKAQINVLYIARWIILLMGLFVFLRAIGIVPPAG